MDNITRTFLYLVLGHEQYYEDFSLLYSWVWTILRGVFFTLFLGMKNITRSFLYFLLGHGQYYEDFSLLYSFAWTILRGVFCTFFLGMDIGRRNVNGICPFWSAAIGNQYWFWCFITRDLKCHPHLSRFTYDKTFHSRYWVWAHQYATAVFHVAECKYVSAYVFTADWMHQNVVGMLQLICIDISVFLHWIKANCMTRLFLVFIVNVRTSNAFSDIKPSYKTKQSFLWDFFLKHCQYQLTDSIVSA